MGHVDCRPWGRASAQESLGSVAARAPIVCKIAVKPTPSIALAQRTVYLAGGEAAIFLASVNWDLTRSREGGNDEALRCSAVFDSVILLYMLVIMPRWNQSLLCPQKNSEEPFISLVPKISLMRKEFRSLISLEEALSIVFRHLPRTAVESVPLPEARGRILAEKAVSSQDVPGFSRASMDGFAVQAEDTLESREDRPASLRLAGVVPMGVLAQLRVAQGEAAEVSTGSMMPDGADAVVMIEYSQVQGGSVLIRRPVYGGENVQAAGSDIS
ncbi:MAG: hypothetical protein WCG94_05935, partial [Methanothrix sp.]